MRLIPALDLKDGFCVRLLRGDFAAETRYAADPLEVLTQYHDWGAEWVHVIDLDGAQRGERQNRALIAQLARARGLRLQVGGGLRTTQAIAEAFESGALRVVIGSAAVERPKDVREWLHLFGHERLVLAFDVKVDAAGVPLVMTRGWQAQTSASLWEAVARYGAEELRHVLCTDVSRDGTLAGPNVALYEKAVRLFPHLAWQASGGLRDAADLRALASTGVAAAIVGRALLEQRIGPEELQPFLRSA